MNTSGRPSRAAVILAALIAPLTIPILFVLEGALVRGVGELEAFAFLSLWFGVPFSYVASFALGLPTYWLLVYRALDRLWLMVVLGAVAGSIVLVVVARRTAPVFGADLATALHGAVYGAAYAAVWYVIVTRCPRTESSRPQAGRLAPPSVRGSG